MPTTPIIIPLIIAALVLGSLLAAKTRKYSKRKLLQTSLLGGLLNAANAFIVYTLFPPTFSRFAGGNFAGGSQTFTGTFTGGAAAFQSRSAGGAGGETSFILTSFIAGFLIVLAVVGLALWYARRKAGKTEEEPELEDDSERETQEEI